VGKGGPKHHSPKQQAVLARVQGKNISKKTELSLPGEQRETLCHGGLELLVGFPQQVTESQNGRGWKGPLWVI